jgi:hypothetical protein
MATSPFTISAKSAFSVFHPKKNEDTHTLSKAPHTNTSIPTDTPSTTKAEVEKTTEKCQINTLQKLLTGEYGAQRQATAFKVLHIKEKDVQGILSLDDAAKKADLCMKVLYAELATKSKSDWNQWRKDHPDLVLKEETDRKIREERKREEELTNRLFCSETL